MEAVIFVLLLLVLGAVVYIFDFILNSHPLGHSEIVELAERRRRRRGLARFDYSDLEQPADSSEKSKMKAGGEFVHSSLVFRDTPARIAGMLKSKKHEWVVVAFVRCPSVPLIWWNKGPDGAHVSLLLSNKDILDRAQDLGADAIAILHNHPNPSGKRAVSAPSSQDIQSATATSQSLLSYGISVLEFICDRGVPLLYFAAISEEAEPLGPILQKIQKDNARNREQNYRLRKELRQELQQVQITGFGLCHAAEGGEWLQLIHPESGEELGVKEGRPTRIRLKGQESLAFKQSLERAAATVNQRASPGLKMCSGTRAFSNTSQSVEAQALCLASITMDWENIEWDGESFPFTAQNALKLYTDVPYVRSQVLHFSEDTANFLGLPLT